MDGEIHLDYETFNHESVVDVGAWKYSENKSCEVLCAAVSYHGDDPELWLPEMGPPKRLFEDLKNGAELHAHNAIFELAIWLNCLQWPEFDLRQLHCSMALVANFSFPLGLGKAGEAIGADVQKDKEGKRLLNKFSKPRKPSKNNSATRWTKENAPEDFDKLCSYCLDDVRSEMAILDKLPRRTLTTREHSIFLQTVKMDLRGIKLDIPTIKRLNAFAEVYTDAKEGEAQKITGGIATSQRQQIMGWCEEEGYALENYQADYLRSVVDNQDVPARVRAVVAARVSLSKTSISKFQKMMLCACGDGRARGMVQYHGAQRTGRFAGRLIQIHNLPRGNLPKELAKQITEIADAVLDMSYNEFTDTWDWDGQDLTTEGLSALIRSMFVAPKGYELFTTDFANIEGRVLAWMAGQLDVIRQFERNDDVYKHMAATIFSTTYEDVDDDERFVGKQAVLGCGYGMGGPKFLSTCIGYGRDIGLGLAEKTVKIYRRKNNKIVNAWYRVNDAAIAAVKHPGTIHKAFMCIFKVEGDFLFIKLPSGKCLSYHKPLIREGRFGSDEVSYMGVDQFTGKWVRQGTYGGKLVENIVQAVARDILCDSMLLAEDLGYLMLMTVHDELVSMRKIGEGSMDEYNAIIRSRPGYALECPIEVEGHSGFRYKK